MCFTRLALYAAFLTLSAFAQTPATQTFTPIRVNAGGPNYTDPQGNLWSADTATVGYAFSTTAVAGNTTTPTLYQTCRWGSDFGYQFSVPNGSYTVTLKFAEPSRYGPGQRLFNVSLNGSMVLNNFDIFSAAGWMVAIDKSFPVTVTDGQITLRFTAGLVDAPMINAIEVIQVGVPNNGGNGSTSHIRVHAGGTALVDAAGNSWSADNSYSGGSPWIVSQNIANTATPALYQSCRYGYAFSYQFSVANGPYNVVLKFAEVSQSGPGQRVFNVAINGVTVLSNFDIFAAAGGPLIAIDRSFPVTVTNGQITIQFSSGPANSPMINAIDIQPLGCTATSLAQAPSSFTIVGVPDIHYDDLGGNPVPANQAAWATAKAWILAHKESWNIHGVMGLGDEVADVSTGSSADWMHVANDYSDFVVAGIPTTSAPGNHDVSYGAGASNWNAFFATAISRWPLTQAFSGNFLGGLASYHPQLVNQYQRVDVATSVGIVRMGLGSLELFASAADIARMRSYMDADTDRQFILGQHMFLAEVAGDDQSHPCRFGEADCEVSNVAGLLDGAGIWANLKDNPRIILMMNGHSHNDTQNGIHSGHMTDSFGNTVRAVSTRHVGSLGYGTLLLLKFRTDNNTVEVYSWRTASDTADPAFFGTPKIYPWTPSPSCSGN